MDPIIDALPDSSLKMEAADAAMKKLLLVGKGQQVTPNQNDREYPLELWEGMHADTTFQEKLQKGQIIGGLGHPKDGIFDPEKSAIVLREQWVDGDDVLTKHEVLDTPSGKIVRTLYEAGIRLGISSRGRGPSKLEGSKTIVEPGFILEGYDIVIEPSVTDAEPDYVLSESVKKSPEKNYVNLVEARLTSDDVSKEEATGYKSILESVYKDKDSEEFKSLDVLLEEKIKDLPEHEEMKTHAPNEIPVVEEVNKDTAAKTTESSESMSDETKTVERLTEELNKSEVALKEAKDALAESATKGLQEQLDSGKRLIAAQETKMTKMSEQITQIQEDKDNLEKDLDAAKKLVEASLKKIGDQGGNLSEALKDLDAAKKIIEELDRNRGNTAKTTLSAYVQEQVSKFPEGQRAHAKSVLETAKDVVQVNTVMESLKHLVEKVTDNTLPPAGGGEGVTTQEEKDKKEATLVEGMDPLTAKIAKKQRKLRVA